MNTYRNVFAVAFVLYTSSALAQPVHSVTPPAGAHAAFKPQPQGTDVKTSEASSKRAKIEEMIRLTKADQILDQMTSQMSAQMKAAIAQQNAAQQMTPQQLRLTDDFQARVQKIITDAVSWDRLKPIMVSAYSDSYTEEELDGIVAFYRSPAGQAMLNKMPQVIASTMSMVKAQMSDVQPQLEMAMRQYTEAMKQTQTGSTNAAPSKR